jgi:group I intron endonuclease
MIIDINDTYWLNKMIGVYKITSPTGRIYIGSSISINDRFTNYRNGHLKLQRKLCASFKKYTTRLHTFELLEICCKENVRKRERFHCVKNDVLNQNNLNLKIPYEDDGYVSISDETRKKLSEARTGEKNSMYGRSGELSPNFGKKMSKDFCQKISERVSGEKHPMYGKKHSEETKEKLKASSRRISRGAHSQARKVICIETGQIWDCAVDCFTEVGLTRDQLYKMLNNKLKSPPKYKYI